MARVVFIQTEWFEHLGILSLAASVRAAGHDVKIVVGRSPKKVVPLVMEAHPDVAAFSATTGSHKVSLHIASALRPYFKGSIIMGGPHPTFFPEVINDPALDAICRGEADLALVNFLDNLEAGQDLTGVRGFWVKSGNEVARNAAAAPVADLDSLPFPARDLLVDSDPWFGRFSMRRVITGRGCPHECTYCFNRAMRELVKGSGPYVRTRSVDHVIAELKAIGAGRKGGNKEAPPMTINFVDDSFGLNKRWALELLARYGEEIRLPFIVNLRPEQAGLEMVKALADAGCYCVQLGVESSCAETRRKVLGREVTDETLESAVRGVKSMGLKLLTYNIVGLPDERLEDAAETLEWNARMGVDFPRVSIFQPYPRTVLGDMVLSRLAAENGGKVPNGSAADLVRENYFRRSPLGGPESRRIENLHKLYYPYIKLPALRGLILKLSGAPSNVLFDFLFLAAIGAQYKEAANLGARETISLGLKNLKAYFA